MPNWIVRIVHLHRRIEFEVQIALGASFVVFAICATLYFLYMRPADNGGFGCEPDVERLRESFIDNREDLEKILAMSSVDSEFVRISFDFVRVIPDKNSAQTSPDRKLTADRWDEYRRLFGSANLRDGISRGQSSVAFIVSACGQVLAGTTYGYLYTQEKPHGLVGGIPENKSRQTLHIHLSGDWYIFVDYS